MSQEMERADVILSYGGNKPSSNIAVFAQNANGTLDPSNSYPAYDIPEPVAIADMNLDTFPDVVTVHSGWLRAGLFLQKSNGILSSELLYTLPNYYPEDLDIGDVNGDGLPDMLIADNAGLIVLYRNANPSHYPDPRTWSLAHASTVRYTRTLTNAIASVLHR